MNAWLWLTVILGLESGAAELAPSLERHTLTSGVLSVPSRVQAGADGVVDVTLHLHGAVEVVESNFLAAGYPGVLANVTLPGLSAVYRERFTATNTFWQLLHEIQARLEARTSRRVSLRRVTVSSFSAGFGGVRELLRDPCIFERVDALLMADSIYAGFTGPAAARTVDPANLAGFVRFAREAVAGRKRLLITHSQLHTPTYASTVETADYVVRQLEGRRQAEVCEWLGGLQLLSRFQQGQCEILGFAGEDAKAHMQHLRQMGQLLARLRAPPVSAP